MHIKHTVVETEICGGKCVSETVTNDGTDTSMKFFNPFHVAVKVS